MSYLQKVDHALRRFNQPIIVIYCSDIAFFDRNAFLKGVVDIELPVLTRRHVS